MDKKILLKHIRGIIECLKRIEVHSQTSFWKAFRTHEFNLREVRGRQFFCENRGLQFWIYPVNAASVWVWFISGRLWSTSVTSLFSLSYSYEPSHCFSLSLHNTLPITWSTSLLVYCPLTFIVRSVALKFLLTLRMNFL